MSHWAEQYMQRCRWVSGGNGPRDFNCWGFVRHIQRQHYDREIPVVDVERLSMPCLRRIVETACVGVWARVDTPKDGDIVLMPRPGELHVGNWLDLAGGRVLHCARGLDVVAQAPAALAVDGWPRLEFWRPI